LLLVLINPAAVLDPCLQGYRAFFWISLWTLATVLPTNITVCVLFLCNTKL
jgi:hypothetical protein